MARRLFRLVLACSLALFFFSVSAKSLADSNPKLHVQLESSTQEKEKLSKEESSSKDRERNVYQAQELLWQFLRYGLGEKVEAGAKGLVNFPLARQKVFLSVLRQLYTSHFVAHLGLGASERPGPSVQAGNVSVNVAPTGSNKNSAEKQLLLLELDGLADEVKLFSNITRRRTRVMLLSATQLLQAHLGGNGSLTERAASQIARNSSIVDRMVGLEEFLQSIATFQTLNSPPVDDGGGGGGDRTAQESGATRGSLSKQDGKEVFFNDKEGRPHPQVLIVGGGPSGLVSAIHAALEKPRSSVTVLEKRRRYTRNIWFDLYGQVRLLETTFRLPPGNLLPEPHFIEVIQHAVNIGDSSTTCLKWLLYLHAYACMHNFDHSAMVSLG